MNQKERLEEIRKRHEEERKKKQIFYHRVIAGAAAVIALILIILIISGIVSFISGKISESRLRAEQEAAAMATPEPTPVITINPTVISDAYYDNCAFLGNSFVDDLFSANLLKNADYFYKTGLSVSDAMTEAMDMGTVPVVDELKNGKQYNRVFLMFGENELGWVSSDLFTEKYAYLIDRVKQYQPTAKIYLLAITPITKKASDENIDNTNNDQIRVYNELIKNLAMQNRVEFSDIYQAVVDKDGNLPANAATDGVHFGKDYYQKCLLYIQNNDKTIQGGQ